VPQTKPNPKIKYFIKYLKGTGITQYTDDKNNYLYSIKDKIKMPVEMLRSLYNKEVGDSNYHNNKNYILASLDNVVGFNFIPNGTRLIPTAINGLVKLNTYKSYSAATSGNDEMTIWVDYLNRLFPCSKEQEVVVQYLAHMFQKPYERPSWHLLLTSDTGTGKGFLFSDILTPLLCRQVSQVSSYSEVTAKHSTCFDSTMLLMLDDPKSKSESTMTKIKSKLSETYISVERKYEAAAMQKVFTRVVLASNEKRPLKLDNNERRWFAPNYMKHRISTEETQAFIAKLAEWLDDGGLDAVHHWFMSYSLDDFNHKRIHQTYTLKGMIENSIPVLVDDLTDWLETNTVFTWTELQVIFDAPNNLLKRYLVELNYQQSRPTIKGHKLRIWHPNSLSLPEAKASYIAQLNF
jgi:hypothetical protein